MKKIRINELARELEVKPGVILDLLPELGVQEKKTHSSSVDEETAVALRERLAETGEIGSYREGASNGQSHDYDDAGSPQDTAPARPTIAETQPRPTAEPLESLPPVASQPAAPAPLNLRAPLHPPVPSGGTPESQVAPGPAASSATGTSPAAKEAGAVTAAVEPERPAPRFQPLRPP